MEPVYRLRFKVGEIEFEIESSDSKWLEKKEKEYLLKTEKTLPGKVAPSLPSEEGTPPIRGFSINEFYQKYVRRIKSRPRTAVLLVYYLEHMEKQSGGIKTSDLKGAFGRISYPNYNNLNFSDILSRAKRQGMLNLVNNLWTLTITGKDFVLNTIKPDSE